jgi:hypothetical protein
MNILKKKRELEDMLITHKLPKEQDKNKAGRESIEKEKEGLKSLEELNQMKRRLASTSDQNERELIVEMIQKRFGNEAAEEIVKELRLLKDSEDVSPTENSTPPDRERGD